MSDTDADLQAFDTEFGVENLDEAESVDETVETPQDEPASESEDESKEEETKEPEEEESQEEAPEEPEESEAEPNEDQQKELARKAYEARQQARIERQQAQEELAKQHLEQAQDEQDLALRQLQIDAYNNKVNANTDRLTNQYEKALNNIEVFKNPTPEVAEYLSQSIDEFEARFVQMDELGNPVSVNADLTEFLQSKAGLVEKLTQLGARKGKVDSAKEKAGVTPTPSAPAKEPKVDPALDAFEKELDRW